MPLLEPSPSNYLSLVSSLTVPAAEGLRVNNNSNKNVVKSAWSPGQTGCRVNVSWKLGSTCDSVNWPGLACTCTHTLVEIKFALKSTRLATQPESTQVEWRPLTYCQLMKYRIGLLFATCVFLQENLRVRLATRRKSLRRFEFNLRLLATACESVWPGLIEDSYVVSYTNCIFLFYR